MHKNCRVGRDREGHTANDQFTCSMEDASVFVSAEQERLAALLEKVTELVPFSSDAACSELFEAVATFGRDAMEQRAERRRKEFFQLDISRLIDMSKEDVAKRERESYETSPSVVNKIFKKDESLRQPADECKKWTFQEAYNIVKVTELVEEPFLMYVLAKPPVAGNQKPLSFVIDDDAFGSVSNLKGRQATKLKKTLSAALVTYCKSDPNARRIAVVKLKPTEWGGELAKELEEDEIKN